MTPRQPAPPTPPPAPQVPPTPRAQQAHAQPQWADERSDVRAGAQLGAPIDAQINTHTDTHTAAMPASLPKTPPLRMPSTPALWLGGGITLLLAACALLSWFWTPHPTLPINMAQRLQGSSAQHWLGTDALGRDVFSLLLAGARSPLLTGLGAVGMGLVLGSGLGLLAAQQRGRTEAVILKLTDVAFAFPALLTAIMLAAVWGAGTYSAMLAIGLFNIPIFIRISRASAQTIWQREFIQAARVAGKSRMRITWEHVLPHVAPLLLVQASTQFALAILAEAALSYLGLGTQPPQPSWGRMLADAQTLLYQRPALAVYPGICIALAVLGLNFLGDGLRDALDPKADRQE